jgi:hypothetical protein
MESTNSSELAAIASSNYLYFITIAVFTVSALAIFMRDCMKILLYVPVSIVELLSYVFFGTIIYCSKYLTPSFSHILSMPCAFIVSFTMGYTVARIVRKNKDVRLSRDTTNEVFSITLYNVLFFATNVLFYGLLAFYLESLAMGYMCVISFMSLVGFNFGFGPGFIAVGYQNKNVIPSATFAALVVLLLGIYCDVSTDCSYYYKFTTSEGHHGIYCLDTFFYETFRPALLWLGSFVYFISILIMSSWSYARSFEKDVHHVVYFQMQMLAVISGFAAIYFGNLYEIQQLYGIAGTVTTIYFLEKCYEFSSKGIGIYIAFFVSLLLLLGNTYLRSYLLEYGYDQMVDRYFHLVPRMS